MVQIIILTYNRPDLVVRSVASALAQDFDDISVLVSDNSTNEDTKKLVLDLYVSNSKFNYIKRNPTVPSIDHFNMVISEVVSEYFMLFHDDDEMNNNMVSELMSVMVSDSSISAIGSNANVIRHGISSGNMFKSPLNLLKFDNPTQFVTPYLNNTSCAPFPSYLYRKSKIDGLFLDLSKGGKYCDVSFLMSVCNRGPIVWINKPLMNYYIHKGQDSISDVFEDRIKLIKHIVHITDYKLNDKCMKSYRLINIYGEIKKKLCKEKHKLSFKRYLGILVLSIKYSPKHLFPRFIYYTLKLVLNKISIK